MPLFFIESIQKILQQKNRCGIIFYIGKLLFYKEKAMSNQNWNNLGSEFKTAVSDAVNKGDFKRLNFLLTDTVTDVIAEAGTQFKKAADGVQKEFKTTSRADIYKNVENYQKYQSGRNQNLQSKRQSIFSPAKKQMPSSKMKMIGQVSGILYLIFGGIGICFMLLLFFVGLFFATVNWVWPPAAFITILLGFGGFGLLIRKGMNQKKRLSRAKRYISLCDDNMYINIKELADHTHKSPQYVLKDVKKMLQLGFFPEGHLDEKESCLMLDDATYREYVRVEQERKSIAMEEAAKKAIPLTPEEEANAQLQVIAAEGQDYIQKIHHLNDLIEDEVVSDKLYHMEGLLKEIFQRLKEDPSQMPKIRKLMSYYLPTTIKLLQAYSEFDDVSTPNSDIQSAKAEIEKTIDIINEAFTELLNKLFQKSAFDAATDAQVLQTMLAKEGLTKIKLTEED